MNDKKNIQWMRYLLIVIVQIMAGNATVIILHYLEYMNTTAP